MTASDDLYVLILSVPVKFLFGFRIDNIFTESLRVHSLIARAALHSRASAGCNFGQTAGPSLIKFGTREGGREGGEGGEGGEGRGLSTLSTNQNLCDRGA